MLVKFEIGNAIATITLNRPDVFNSINDELLEEMIKNLEKVEQDKKIRVLVLKAEGKAFCAGGDLNHIRNNLKTRDEVQTFIKRLGFMIKCLHDLRCPSIAMLNGVAAGAGANLALACDLIYCSSNASFVQSFVKVGLIPDAGGHYFLPRAVGLAKAKELMFTADLIDAASALKLGLVNNIFPPDKLNDDVYAQAAKLAEGPPLALAAIKRNLNMSFEKNFQEMLDIETEEQVKAIMSLDGIEGMSAFCEKRKAVFKGV